MTNETFYPENSNAASDPPKATPSPRRKRLVGLVSVGLVTVGTTVPMTLAYARIPRENGQLSPAGGGPAQQTTEFRLVSAPVQDQRHSDGSEESQGSEGQRDQRPGDQPPGHQPSPNENQGNDAPSSPTSPNEHVALFGGGPSAGMPSGSEPHGGPQPHLINVDQGGRQVTSWHQPPDLLNPGEWLPQPELRPEMPLPNAIPDKWRVTGGVTQVFGQSHGKVEAFLRITDGKDWTDWYALLSPNETGRVSLPPFDGSVEFELPAVPLQQAICDATTCNTGGPFAPSFGSSMPVTEADRRAAELAGRLRQADDESQRETLRKELTDVLGQAFEQRRQQQQSEIQRLERQLESIRQLDQKRQERKNEIVQKRLAELIGEPDTLAWDVAMVPPRNGQSPLPGMDGRSPQPPIPFGPATPEGPTGIPLGQPNSGSYPITPYLITPPETSTVPGDRSFRAPVPGSVIFPAPTVIDQSGLPSAPANRPIGRTQADRVATVTVGDIGAAAQTVQPFSRFEMAQRIFELSDEIRRHRQMSTALLSRPAGDLPPRMLKESQSNERLAKAKLALAESEWKNMGGQLRAQADEADQRLESAQQRSAETLQPVFAPWQDVLQSLRSEAQARRQNFEAWSRTDQVLRSAIEDLSEPD
jgi:hypothetical protein